MEEKSPSTHLTKVSLGDLVKGCLALCVTASGTQNEPDLLELGSGILKAEGDGDGEAGWCSRSSEISCSTVVLTALPRLRDLVTKAVLLTVSFAQSSMAQQAEGGKAPCWQALWENAPLFFYCCLICNSWSTIKKTQIGFRKMYLFLLTAFVVVVYKLLPVRVTA